MPQLSQAGSEEGVARLSRVEAGDAGLVIGPHLGGAAR